MPLEYSFDGFTPHEIAVHLRQIIDFALLQNYGDHPDRSISRRISEEWNAMERTGVIVDIAALYELTIWLKKNHRPYWMHSCSGSSFILYLLGITAGNPLPPHYYCPKCKSVQWQPSCKDGFDLPQNVHCPEDDTLLISDGHDIPWQTLFGYGTFCPQFEIALPGDLFETIQIQWASHWIKKSYQALLPPL